MRSSARAIFSASDVFRFLCFPREDDFDFFLPSCRSRPCREGDDERDALGDVEEEVSRPRRRR